MDLGTWRNSPGPMSYFKVEEKPSRHALIGTADNLEKCLRMERTEAMGK